MNKIKIRKEKLKNQTDYENNHNVSGFTLVEVIVALTILAIMATMFVPSFTSYIDKAYEAKATAETKYVITASQSKLVSLYANGNISKYIERDGFTITSNTIKKVKSGSLYDDIEELAEVKGEIKSLWIDEKKMEIAGLAYQIGDGTYFVIYAPNTEEKSYVFSATNTDSYNEYKAKLKELENSKWK